MIGLLLQKKKYDRFIHPLDVFNGQFIRLRVVAADMSEGEDPLADDQP